METISSILKWIFTYLFYPAIIIAIFGYIISTIVSIVTKGRNASAIARRLTGSLLPLVLLIFVVVADQGDHNVIADLVASMSAGVSFLVGAALGLALMEVGKFLLKTDSEVGPSVYALFLSSAGVFILYSIMIGILKNLHLPLFGMVVFGGLDIIFRGPPSID
jgi:hypothetical protein